MSRLTEIENELLINQKKLSELSNPYMYMNMIDNGQIKQIENRNEELDLERQHILDRRNSWKPKIFWDVLVPIIVTIITTYLISILSVGIGPHL